MADHPLDDFFRGCYRHANSCYPGTYTLLNAVICCARGPRGEALRAAALTWHPNPDWTAGEEFRQAMLNPPLPYPGTNPRSVMRVQRILETYLEWDKYHMKRSATHG